MPKMICKANEFGSVVPPVLRLKVAPSENPLMPVRLPSTASKEPSETESAITIGICRVTLSRSSMAMIKVKNSIATRSRDT